LSKEKNPFFRKLLEWIEPYLVGSVALREKSKNLIVNVYGELRMVFKELGKALKREGKIPRERLIFSLTLYEVGSLINQHSAILVQK
jgi:hypothetical protein